MASTLNSPPKSSPNNTSSASIRSLFCSYISIQQALFNKNYTIHSSSTIMATSKSHSSFLALLSIVVILLAITGQAFAGRDVPQHANKDEKKEPDFFFQHDGSFLIPGFGRVAKPYKFLHHSPPYTAPRSGGITGTGSSPPGRNYVPGGDDTFVPNPGFEVPNPGHP